MRYLVVVLWRRNNGKDLPILVAIFVLVGAAAAACLARDLRRIQMMQRVNMRKNKIATSGVVVAIIIPVLSDDELRRVKKDE